MATYTLRQYTTLVAARAAGVLSNTVEGRSTTYRSLAEMDKIIASMEAQLLADGLLEKPQQVTRFRMIYSKGL